MDDTHPSLHCQEVAIPSLASLYRYYSRRAAESGNFQAARKYARKALFASPLYRQNLWIFVDAYFSAKMARTLKNAYRTLRGLSPLPEPRKDVS